jgi:hypothetical protein
VMMNACVKPPEKLKSYYDDQVEHSELAGDAEQRETTWHTGDGIAVEE